MSESIPTQTQQQQQQQQRWTDRLSSTRLLHKDPSNLRTPPLMEKFGKRSALMLLNIKEVESTMLALFQNKPIAATAHTHAFLTHRIEMDRQAPVPMYQMMGQLQSRDFITGFQFMPQQGFMYAHAEATTRFKGDSIWGSDGDNKEDDETANKKKKKKNDTRELTTKGKFISHQSTVAEGCLEYKSTDYTATASASTEGDFSVSYSQALTKNFFLGVEGSHSLESRTSEMVLGMHWLRGDSTWSARYTLGDLASEKILDSRKLLRVNYITQVSPVFSYAGEFYWDITGKVSSYRLGFERTLLGSHQSRVRATIDNNNVICTMAEFSAMDFFKAPFQVAVSARVNVPNNDVVYGLTCGYAG